jgi:hypothetical protein
LSEFESRIRAALGRKDPEPDFTARVMARVARTPARHVQALPPPRRWIAGAIAAALVLSAAGWEVRRNRQGHAAKAQVMLALRIAGSKLNMAQKKITELSGPNKEQQE